MPSPSEATSSVRAAPSIKRGFHGPSLHHFDRIAPACVHCLLAGLLVLGGAAKAASYGAWLGVPVGVCELVLAVVVISGVTVRPIHWLLVVVFFSFALASAVRIFRGDSSCGCFGEIPVSPWLILTVDALAVAALLRWTPPNVPEPKWIANSRRVFALLAAILLFAFLVNRTINRTNPTPISVHDGINATVRLDMHMTDPLLEHLAIG